MEKIKQAFPKAKIFAWYGHAERAILAHMCEHSNQYHLWPFYGYTEIINEENKEVSQGQSGELIGTSWWMTATPFIRYRTMDRAINGEPNCNKCGRIFQLLKGV